MLDALLERFRQHDRLALSRLLSILARGRQQEDLLRQLGPPSHPRRVVALTGAGGVGKSSLVGKLIEHYRSRNQTVAVLACDPQSPLSGGALLGDRFRMPSQPDDGVFIRSLVAVAGHGAIADHLPAMIRALETFGFDLILIETAGAGQGDTVVRDLVDVVVLLLQPEAGDDLQWEKAGVMEVADIIAVHKADLPGAERAEAQVRAALDVSGGVKPAVLRVSARTGEGVDALAAAIEACPLRRQTAAGGGRDLLRLAQELLAERFTSAADSPQVKQIVADWQSGSCDPAEAAVALVGLLLNPSGPSLPAPAKHRPPG